MSPTAVLTEIDAGRMGFLEGCQEVDAFYGDDSAQAKVVREGLFGHCMSRMLSGRQTLRPGQMICCECQREYGRKDLPNGLASHGLCEGCKAAARERGMS